ncbi:AAA_11 domain-containing protein [Caerostris extrusa]|uniref:AAA_11 domain-containing protein n=1 Tax=Caerostris extrusa TaxID=172846 RepID=A0AAV4UIY8_CAEEX|nr:AAA_11 domain-containing protein [Caerostris extrusa]
MKIDAILENSSSSIKFSKNTNVINAVDDDKLHLSNLNDFSEVQKYSNNDVSNKEMSCDIQNSLIESKSLNKCNHSTLQISKEKCIQNSFDYNTESQMYKLPPKLSIDSTESLSRISHQEFTKTGSEGNELPHLEYSVSEGVLSNRCSNENEKLVKHAFPEERAVNDLIDEKVSPSLSFLQQNRANMENKEFLPTFNAQNSISSPVLNMVNVPTTELLKILQTVNNLPSSEFSHKSLSKNKNYSPNSAPQIIDYDHGMSSDNRHLNLDRENSYSKESFLKFPVVHDYGHKPIKDTNKDNCNSKEVFPTARNTVSITESTVSTCSKSEYSSDTDVDCSNDVPGSPFESHCDDQNANISKKNPDEKKEETVKSSEDKDCKNIPQYKSRWEKIMERKSLENSSKEKFNEHLLKDYFPIQSLKQKSNIQKPIAHVQPCSKISPKNIPHVNKSLFSKETFKKDKIHSSKSKAIVDKNNSSTKNKSLEEASNLFKKDKIVKKKPAKHFVDNKKRENSSITLNKIVTQKKTKLSNDNERNRENSSTARLLNRITNRGSFLTQASVNQSPKSKIYTHKKNKNKNKGVSKGKIYADELHMMIHSPKIEIPSINKAAASHVSKSNDNNRKIASFTELNMERVMSPSENSVENSLICQNFADSNKTVISLAYDNSFKSSKHYSNSFISESVSSNLPSVFQNTSQDNNCFPFDLPFSSSLKIGVKRPLLGRRTLLPTPSFHTYKNINKDEFWTSSPNLNTPRNDFDNEISSPIQSPLLTDSSVDFNVNSPYFSSPHSVHLPSSHMHNRNNHHRHSRSRQSKCVCLPPRLLKTSVGNAVFDTINVLLLILEWNVDWLAQQQKFMILLLYQHRPKKKIVNVYENRDEYYNTYFPLMLLETWQRIYMSWTHLHQASPYFCEITSYKVETHSIKVECQAVFRSSDAERGYFPEEGNIIMVKFGTKDKGGIKILGYIKDVKVKLFDAGNDPQNMSYQALKYTSGESLKLLLLTFTSVYTSEDFDMSHLVRIQVLCSVKSTLKQNDAMLNIKDSPLFKNILNPLSDGLRTATVAMRTVDPVIIKDNVSKSVKDILQGKPTDVHQKLRKYLLDDLAAKTLNEGHLINEESKGRLLENTKIDIIKNCDVILSLIRNSHNDFVAKACEDDDCIAQMCCIIDEANLCTEPEILIPLLYGMSKLILIGDPDVHAKVCSKTAVNFDYNRSLFHRAYELDQL